MAALVIVAASATRASWVDVCDSRTALRGAEVAGTDSHEAIIPSQKSMPVARIGPAEFDPEEKPIDPAFTVRCLRN